MEDKEIQKKIEEFFNEMAKVGEIKNPYLAMNAFLKLGERIKEIYKEGYSKGFEQGKKNWSQKMPKN
jgi:phosphosulfolactate synthase (CoM biosynthesis protein A)